MGWLKNYGGRLPRGSTGLVTQGSTVRFRGEDEWREARSIFHAVARTGRYRLSPHRHRVTSSFQQFALVSTGPQQPSRWLLAHTVHALVAFSEQQQLGYPWVTNFVDAPVDTSLLTNCGWHVLDRATCEQPVTARHLSDLSEQERTDVLRHFQPHTIGQLLFNFWD